MTHKFALQQDLITSNLSNIINDLVHLRINADLTLLPKYPYFSGKPYPIGRCREIRDKVFELLSLALIQPKTSGIKTLMAYIQQGNRLQKRWGGLKDMYFQNAIQIGDYYIDVANDTVNPNKPRVEVLLMKDSGFTDISSFEHFIKISKIYWEVDVYKNTVCSSLAPLMPILFVNKKNKSRLEGNNVIVSLALKSEFEESRRLLARLPEPNDDLKQKWHMALKELNTIKELNNDRTSIEYCNIYRSKGLHNDHVFRNKMVEAFKKIPQSI